MARKRHDTDDDADDDLEVDSGDEDLEAPSRGARKRASHELRELGVELTKLADARVRALPLPEPLRDAILEARRLTSFGAQRRQAQFIGKLMRRLDAQTVAAVRAVIDADRAQVVRAAAALHRAERWRDALIADDAELERWLAEFPATDAQRLRALIRQARKDARTEEIPGQAPRQGSAYRQVFALVRAALAARDRGAADQ